MRKLLVICLVLALMLSIAACIKTKELHCDHCGKVCEVAQSSNMEEDWIIYCKECEEELFGDNPVVQDMTP